MEPTALKSKPTIHNGALNKIYKSQQPERSTSKASYAASDITTYDNGPRSPVSPLDSYGETWKHPPRAQAHLNGLGTLYEVPLDEAPKDHFRSRPMSYYDGLQTSPEPDDKAVFADLPVAPPKPRLSRPFDQPHPIPSHGQISRQEKPSAPPANVPMQTNMTRADSHLRRQPAESFSKRKAAPAPLTIPPPAHQPKRQYEPNPHQEAQPHTQRSGPHQGKQAPAQRTALHQGWNPLEEPPRQQRTAHAEHKDRRQDRRRDDDLEWQAGLTRSNNRSKHDDPQYKSGRRCFFFLLIMMILVIVIIVVVARKNMHNR